MVRTGYEGFATDVDWCNCCIGFAAPTSASRSGDGENIDFSLSFAPVFRGQDSTFFGAITDARQFDLSGRLTLYLEDGTSATVTVSAPVLDATPPQVRITSPAPESVRVPVHKRPGHHPGRGLRR
ncbi:MAG: hypothetical protein KatS3mg103_1260 [Phycisphaerales bacterium]|nr:MAG: hypothetical protein KatS3mg103_1260 [Phycisphaerales bacterium]